MDGRLGYLVPEFPGPTAIMFWREIGALRAMGVDVSLVSTRKPSEINQHDFHPEAAAETYYLFPPKIHHLGAWLAKGCPNLSQARGYWRKLEDSNLAGRLTQYGLLASAIDLVRWARWQQINHVHGHSCANTAHLLALARCLGGPSYSLTLHGDLEVYGQDHRSKMAGAKFVCVVGNHLRRQVTERAGVTPDRILVTCMGVDSSKLETLGADRSYALGTLHVVTVARLNAVKGHLYALAAIHRGIQSGLDLHYTIAGEGPFRDAIETRINELGLRDRVTLAGSLAELEVFRLLSRADAFLLPSTGKGEAWPVSVMEAMAAGLPVIASEIGATPEMITPGEDGFLVPQADAQGILDKITLLANDVGVRTRIGKAARLTARRRFDVSSTAKALIDAIENVGSEFASAIS
jgi:colanic acid/amylovoran biosynthesis glycosyltransferase